MFTARALGASNIVRVETHRKPRDFFATVMTNGDCCYRIVARETKL